MPSPADVVTGALIGTAMLALVWAAGKDILTRTVPDSAAIVVVLCGSALRAMTGDLLWALAAAALLAAILLALYAARWIGGGDIKLLGGTVLLVPPLDVPSLLAAIVIAGGTLAAVALLARRFVTRVAPPLGRHANLLRRALVVETWRLRRGAPIPYAVAILAGTAIHLYW